jgi:small GTP-binding protein
MSWFRPKFRRIEFCTKNIGSLFVRLRKTRSEAAAYEFTTLTCIPGTMNYKGARIQVLDLPGIIEGAADGKGRGRQVISTARTCNMILVVLDAAKPLTHKKIIEQELFSFGIRINQKPPEVKVVKKVRSTCSWCRALSRMLQVDLADV